MFCRNCGKEISNEAVMCVNCGVPPKKGNKYCQNCGAETDPNAEVCVKCGVKLAKATGEGKDWLTTLLLCIFLGPLGIHRFYTGHTGTAILQIFTLGGCGIWLLIDFIKIVTGKFKDKEGNPLVRKN